MATPRYIEEYIPVQIYTVCFGLFYFSQNVGGLLAMFSGLLLPPDDDTKALKESNMWLFIYGFPAALYLLMVILMLTVVRYDSPKYSLVTGKKENCIAVIHQIYKTGGSRELAEEIA